MTRLIKVVHTRDRITPGFTRVDIHRPHVLGNPFHMKSEAERSTVIKKYRCWLWGQMQDPDSPASIALDKLANLEGNLELACFCAPKACHGDIVKAAIEWLRKEAYRSER